MRGGLEIWCNGKRVQAFKRKSDDVYLIELPAFMFPRTTKQSTLCRSAGDRLRKFVRNFLNPTGC